MKVVHGTPADVQRAWGEAFAARDLDAMMELFEDSAIWVAGDGSVVEGLDGIRSVFADFLALDAVYEAQPPEVAVTGGFALLRSQWTVRGTARDGSPVQIAGCTSDVLRRGPDGAWRYLIDAPFSGAQTHPTPTTEGSSA